MKKKIIRGLKGMLTVSAIAASLLGCGGKTLTAPVDPSVPQATFDGIYEGRYNGYTIMYEGIPYRYEYSSEPTYLTLFFKDKETGRRFYASCSLCLQQGVNVAVGFLKDAEEEELPVRIYGNEQDLFINLDSISFLVGQGRWENIDIGTITPRYYPTPTPYTTSTQEVK